MSGNQEPHSLQNLIQLRAMRTIVFTINFLAILMTFMLSGCRSSEARLSSLSDRNYKSKKSRVEIKFSPEDIAIKAKISDLNLANLLEVERQYSATNFRVILPTYIPTSFELFDLSIGSKNHPSGQVMADVKIIYSDKSGGCLTISMQGDSIGGGSEGHETIEVYAPAFGNINVTSSSFSGLSGGKIMTINYVYGLIESNYIYDVSSSDSNNFYGDGCYDSVEPQVFIKVVESMNYLSSD